jgi:hypothetical protein
MQTLTGGQQLCDDVVLICLRLQPSAPDAAVPQEALSERCRWSVRW